MITWLLAKTELKRNCNHMSAVFGSPLGACGKWQVRTAIVKCCNKATVFCIFHVPITDKFWRSRKCNVTSTSGCASFQNGTSKWKSRYVAKKKKKQKTTIHQKSFNTQRRKKQYLKQIHFSVFEIITETDARCGKYWVLGGVFCPVSWVKFKIKLLNGYLF